MAEKKEKKLTPVGEAKWAHVQTPKAPFVENGVAKGGPQYQIDVVFDPAKDEKWKEWARDLQEKVNKLPPMVNKKSGEPFRNHCPINRELDENDNFTGRYYASFKTSAKFKPPVFDKYGKVLPIEIMVGNGSKVQVSYSENVYASPAFGPGINLYLNGLQVKELVEYGAKSADSFGFEVEKEDNPEELPPF